MVGRYDMHRFGTCICRLAPLPNPNPKHGMRRRTAKDAPNCERHNEMRRTHRTAKDTPNRAMRHAEPFVVNARGSVRIGPRANPCPRPPVGDVVASLGITVAWPVGKCALNAI